MTASDTTNETVQPRRSRVSIADLDYALTVQLAVAWAGEGGEDARLGWWRSDLVSEYGGEDLFQRVLPATWRWGVLQAAREAARRRDADLRAQAHDPDGVVSLFYLGFADDERVEERLQDLKRAGAPPEEALPSLAKVTVQNFDRDRFLEWVRGHGKVSASASPTGRLISGEPPPRMEDLVAALVGALDPLGDSYPLPHFRRSRRKK